MKTKFKIGDKVKSDPTSCDVTMMKAVWVAVIHAVRCENDEGGCFETVGHWEPLVDENGKVSPLWADHDPEARPTLRQLYGNHLIAA